jgi:N-acetyl-alpha-D-glucosaminyl L-malate synthase BshA
MSRPLRIVIIGSPALGGSGVMAHRIAEGMARGGDEVIFLSYAEPFSGTSPLIRYELSVPASHPLFPFPLQEAGLAERLYDICMRGRVDVVHAHYAVTFGQAAALALRALPQERRPRLVLTCHGTDIVGTPQLDRSFLANKLIRPLLSEAEVLTTVSQDLADRVRALYGLPRTIVVVPNFVDLSLYTAKERRGGPLRVLHASNFRTVKQTGLVVDTVRMLGDASLHLIGNGPERVDTLERAERLLGKMRVTWYGALSPEEVVLHTREADIALIPSLYESFSLSALEAHACGVPVVGSIEGGMGEVVRNGETGLLLEPTAPAAAWAKAVRKAIALPHVRERAREQAERFSADGALRAYRDLYLNGTPVKTRSSPFVSLVKQAIRR